MRVAIYTLGCKVNQYETQAMEAELTGRGHALVPFDGAADAYVINTCTVTAVSDKKSRQMIRQARKRSPHAVVAVCGCYAQTDPEAVEALGVDLVMGTADRMGFLDALEALSPDGGHPVVRVDDALRRRQYEHLPAGGLEGRTRAMLKVEDGCVNFCTYCIIPYARGPIRSLPLEEAACEAKRLAGAGYRELVLTGIEISSWGHDLKNGQGLIDLVEAVCAAAPECRVRLGSLEPRTVTEDFCRRAAALPNLCPHFHLSMQSGCDATLKRMNRKYDSARYYESVTLLREHFDRPGITTRRDGGGVRPDPGLCTPVRLLRHAHLPLLPPYRHPGGRPARPGAQGGKGGAGPPGGGGGGGAAGGLAGALGGGDPDRALRGGEGGPLAWPRPQLYGGLCPGRGTT